MPIRVMIADDHAVVREGLKMMLEAQDDIVVIATVLNGQAAVEQAEALLPDVILMDVAMPELNGIEAARLIVRRRPQVKVLMLSMHNTSEHVFRALQAGALGYLLKESAGSEVVSAVRAVMRGGRFIGNGVELPCDGSGQELTIEQRSPLESLSDRERQVLQLVVEGRTSADIADRLSLSPKSVETYRSRLMLKLGITNIPALVKFALEHGITPVA